MFARPGTSVGLSSWWVPWRERKAIGAPEGVRRILIGEEGAPQGVVILRRATWVKPLWVRASTPVPPMTAMRTGSVRLVNGGFEGEKQ